MRYYEIQEARRNPISDKTGKELNPRVPLTDKLEQYKDREDIFISYVMDMGDLQPKGGKNIEASRGCIYPSTSLAGLIAPANLSSSIMSKS